MKKLITVKKIGSEHPKTKLPQEVYDVFYDEAAQKYLLAKYGDEGDLILVSLEELVRDYKRYQLPEIINTLH